MDVLLLESKLTVPPLRASVVTRERLLEQLNLDATVKALLLSAPAGFGKTTLVSEWLQRSDVQAAWLSLDSEDNDLKRLFAHLLSAIRTAVPSLGEEELELLNGARTVEADALLAPLLNRAATLTEPLCIVLDDYHLITNPDVHEAIDFILEYAPPTVKLCFITRADPPLKLAKLRARAQLIELRSDDLRFTTPETTSFLGANDVTVSEEDAEALAERAEGWAVGLQVMALSLTDRNDGGKLLDELTHGNRFLLDYMLDEVLSRQPEEVQTFLLKTSITDEVSVSLCHALLDPEDISVSPAEMLAKIERDNLFLRPLDGKRKWFKYHQLFKDVLFHRLEALHPQLIKPLRQCAAEWYAANGYIREALEQLLAGNLMTEAADYLAEIGPTLIWQHGDAATLEAWLERLPAETLATRPDLIILRAWAALVLGNITAIAPMLDEAELLSDILDVTPEATLAAESSALRGFAARMQGDYDRSLELSYAALEALPESAYGLRSLVNGNLGEVHYLTGDLDKGHLFHKEESRLAEKEGAVLPSRFALWRIADIQTLRGELETAKRTCHTMLNLNKLRSVDALGFADIQLGVIAVAQNDLEEAERRITAGLDIGKRLNNPRVFMPAYGPLAQTLLAQDRTDEAQEVLNEGFELAEEFSISETWGLPALDAWQAYLDVRSGKADKAYHWVERVGLSKIPSSLAFTKSFSGLVAAHVLVTRGEQNTALALLNLPVMAKSRPCRDRCTKKSCSRCTTKRK